MVKLRARLLYAAPCLAQGWAPLHSAVSAGHDDVVQRLLSAGADIGIRTSGEQTPLHYAVRHSLCTTPPAVRLSRAQIIQGLRQSEQLDVQLLSGE